MSSGVQKTVLLPRFTSLVGSNAFHTAAMNVRQFASATISVWRGQECGSNLSAFDVRLQESADLSIWSDVGSSFSPAAHQEVSEARDLDVEWIRLVIELVPINPGGTPPAVTCWAVANLVPRETPK
jgi:hypothetical protein